MDLTLPHDAPNAGPRTRLPSDALSQRLREMIVTQRLAPGSRLKERDLAIQFGVSRSAIRDALGVLSERKLIVRYPNRGAEVVRLGRVEILNIYETREVLEGLAARLATERSESISWEDLVQLFDGPAERAVKECNFSLYLKYLDRLAERVIAAAGNPVLEEQLGLLADRIAVLARRSVFLPGRSEQGLIVHRAVIAAMRRGDADAAERLKRQSLRNARDTLLKYEDYVL